MKMTMKQRDRYAWIMGFVLTCSVIFLPVCLAQEAEENSEKNQELLSLKEKQEKILDQYNQDKKNLEKSYQEKLSELDESPENRSARVRLISDMKREQKELMRSFQSDLRSVQKKENKIRNADRPYVNSAYVQSSSQKQQRQSLRKRIKAQDEKYGNEFNEKFGEKKESWDEFNKRMKSSQERPYTRSRKTIPRSTTFPEGNRSHGSGYSY